MSGRRHHHRHHDHGPHGGDGAGHAGRNAPTDRLTGGGGDGGPPMGALTTPIGELAIVGADFASVVLHQPVARVRIQSSTMDPVESTMTAEAELLPAGATAGEFEGFETRAAAELRARAAVDPDAARPEVHVTVIVREPGPDETARFHVFDTGRQPLRAAGDDPPTWTVSPLSRAGQFTTVEVVRFTRDDAATQRGAAGMPVLAAQEGPTCGAASLVAYVVAQDAERGGAEHTVFTTAVANVIAHARAHRGTIVTRLARFATHGAPAEIFDGSMTHLGHARDLATAGDVISAAPLLTRYLYMLYQGTSSAGMTDAEASQASEALGVQGSGASDDRPRDANVEDFDALFTNAVVQSLHPGEAAQVSWLAGAPGRWVPHYFLIGLRPNRQAYFYDQATPYQHAAPDLDTLRRDIRSAIFNGLHYYPAGPRPQGLFSSSAHRVAPDRI